MSPAPALPEKPQFRTSSERGVFDRAVRQLWPGCVVLANVTITTEFGDREADLIVLVPGSGIIVVEVKGSHVWAEGDQWFIQRERGPEPIDPVEQVRACQYALRSFVESDPRWGSRRRVRWSRHVVLTGTTLPDDFAHRDMPRWQVSDRGDLATLGERLNDTTELHDRRDAAAPTQEDVNLVVEILQGRNLPARNVAAIAAEREERANRLTTEQANLLKVTRLLNRLEIRGGAGSGKTVMAIQQARDLAAGRLTGERKRVAVVCYSYGLGTYLAQELERGSRKERPAFVGTYEDLARRWGVTDFAGRDDSPFWEVELPRQMAQLAEQLPHTEKFDAIIVDEAQDFAEDWWLPLLTALRDEETGGLCAYADEQQRVFARFGRPPVQLIPLVLDHNLRNTRQIAGSFAALAPKGMRLLGGDGPEPTFVQTALEDSFETADEQVEALLDEGWEPRDIALITTSARHPVQKERQAALGQQGYWDSFWDDDDVFYGQVLGFKGMERRAVVLCVNEDGTRDRAAERLYVGLSRATDRLVVVGDAAMIRGVGGAETCRKLGIRG